MTKETGFVRSDCSTLNTIHPFENYANRNLIYQET